MSVVSTNNKDKIIYNNLPKNIDNILFIDNDYTEYIEFLYE